MEGALMPAALPGLLMGHDLPIYAVNNTGRGYRIGYILGLNTCGYVLLRHRLLGAAPAAPVKLAIYDVRCTIA